MKSLKTKVILSAFVLLFALVATIGSTYAWFTVSSTVSVDSMNIDVQSQDSLLIQIYDGESAATALGWMSDVNANFGQSVTVTDSSLYANLATWRLRPLTVATAPTTTNETDYTSIDLDKLSFLNDLSASLRPLTDAVAADPTYTNTANGGYIELKFWVVSQAVGNDVVLQDLTITTADSTVIDQAIAVGTIEDDTPTNKHIFAKDPDYGFVFQSGFTGYNGTDTLLNSVETPSTLLALHGLFYDSDGSLLATYADATDGSVTGTSDDPSVIATLAANVPELITVRIWLEGWDAEATNQVISASFDIAFEFAIYPTVA